MTTSWTPLSGVVLTGRLDASCVLVDRQLLVVGGQAAEIGDGEEKHPGSRDMSLTEGIDLDLRRRFQYGDLLQARTGCVAAQINNLVVVIGGWSDKERSALDSVEVWNKAELRWTKGGTTTEKRCFATSATIPESKIIAIIGGRDQNGTILKSVEIGDVGLFDREIVWTSLKKPMNVPRMGACAVAVENKKLLVIGGFDGTTKKWTTSCEIYSPQHGEFTKGAWTKFADLPEAVRHGKAVQVDFSGRTFVLVAGGRENGSGCLLCLDVRLQKWLWGRALEQPHLDGCGMAVLDSTLYIVEAGQETKRRVFCCELNDAFFQSGPANALPVFPKIDGRFPYDGADLAKLPVLDNQEINFKGHVVRYTGQSLPSSPLPHGVGKVNFSTADSFYLGTFRDGVDEGIGEFFLKAQNWRYVGGFDNGDFSGYGFFQSGTMEYFGNFKGGKMCGYGRCTFRRDNRRFLYTGEWQADRAHGPGTVVEYTTGKLMYAGVFEEGLAREVNSGKYKDFYTGEVKPKDKFPDKYRIGYE